MPILRSIARQRMGKLTAEMREHGGDGGPMRERFDAVTA